MKTEKRSSQKILIKVMAVVLSFVCIFTTNVFTANAASVPVITSVKAKSSTSVKLKWKKMSDVSGYVVYQKKEDGKYKLIKTINSGKSTGCTVKKLNSGTKYSYKIKAFTSKSSKKYTSFSKSKTVYTNLSTPQITYIEGKTANSIVFKWKKISKADGYIVYRKTRDGFDRLTKIDSPSTNKFIAKGLTKEKKYGFTVRAFMKTGSKTIYSSYADVKYSFPTMPVNLQDLHCIEASAHGVYKSGYVNSPLTDSFGNVYSGYVDFQECNSKSSYIVYNLNNEYNTLSFDIVMPNYIESISSSLEIYADDVLIFKKDGISKTMGKVHVNLEVENCGVLKMLAFGGGSLYCGTCLAIVNAKVSK